MDYSYGLGLTAPFAGSYGVSSEVGIRKAPKTNHGRGSSKHYGTDFLTPLGTPALASMDGVVTRVANDPKGYGNYLAICNNGVCANYAHLSEVNVKQGQRVTAGQPIAKTGNTGNTSGAHLDYTVTKNGVAVRHDGSLFAPTGKAWLAGNTQGVPVQQAQAIQPQIAAIPTTMTAAEIPQAKQQQAVDYQTQLAQDPSAIMAEAVAPVIKPLNKDYVAKLSDSFFKPINKWYYNG